MNFPTHRLIALAAIVAAFTATTVSAQVTESFTEPIQASRVAASEQGVIAAIAVKEGQAVTAGELLGHLDNDALQQSLRIAKLRADSKSEIRKAQSTLRVRQKRRDTLQPMLRSGHANPSEVEESVVEYEVALSDAELAQEKNAEYVLEVDRIKAQIRAREIRSPMDGIVSELHYELGEFMSSNKPQFATVVRIDQLLVRFYLLESDVLALRQNQKVPLKLRVGTEYRTVMGKIRFISPVTNPDSGTARIDVVIDNQDGRYRSGSPCHWPNDLKPNDLQTGQNANDPFPRNALNRRPHRLPHNSLRPEGSF